MARSLSVTSTAVNSTLMFDARRCRFSRASASAARTGDSGGRFFAAGLRARGAGAGAASPPSNSKSSWMAGAAAGFARRAAAGELGEATLWDFGLFLFEGALGPEVRRQMERVRPAGVEWSYVDDDASPQPAVVE